MIYDGDLCMLYVDMLMGHGLILGAWFTELYRDRREATSTSAALRKPLVEFVEPVEVAKPRARV